MASRLKQEQMDKIKAMDALGISYNQIADIMGLSKITVRRVATGTREKYLERHQQQRKEERPQQMEMAEAAPITDKALYETMKNAMLDAMNEALARNMSNLRGMVLAAIRGANQ